MQNTRKIAFQALVAAATLASTLIVEAQGLYKSVDSQGRVTFSDIPVAGAVTVQRIATSESAKPVEAGNSPIYLALADGFDEAVMRANAKVDMAEHALAQARRGLIEDNPLSLVSQRAARADSQRLDFFKRDVLAARKELLRAIQNRNAIAARAPVA